VKDDVHGVLTPEMMKLSQTTWIETFVEGVTDSCAHRLHVNTVGLSKDGFTRKGRINSIRN
jgi:hypothetical protein